MPVVATRMRSQAPPPHIVFEALTQPDRDPTRPWLDLLDGERRPSILASHEPASLVWSSLWVDRPDATIAFELRARESGGGTDLRWTLSTGEPAPDDAAIRRMSRRLNVLINADLRGSFDQ